MSTRSSIINTGPVHIYHEWNDEGFVYVHNVDDDSFKLCSLEDWYEIVRYIKDNDKDVNGKDILTGKWFPVREVVPIDWEALWQQINSEFFGRPLEFGYHVRLEARIQELVEKQLKGDL